MSTPDDRLEELVAEALDRLQDDPQFDLGTFVRAHPEQEAELGSQLEKLRAAGMLPGNSPSETAASAASPTPRGPESVEELLEALRRKPALHERYEVLQEIGRGGMGRVVAVFDRELRRTLAMKILRTPSSEPVRREMVARFLEEARITGQLNHQGIVPIHDLGIDETGTLYYTMRLIEGRRTLATVFELAQEEKEGWTRVRALDAILRACEAVAYAHQRGVIHRDLKPSNIMVGPLGEVFVVDWGLSRVLEAIPLGEPGEQAGLEPLDTERSHGVSPFVTVQGRALGTPYYMSPEQARGERDAVDARSDVYAMAAILYEFLAGHPPYSGDGAKISSLELVDKIIAGPPKGITEAAPREPAELVAICAKAMQRRPEDRFPSITELAGDLRAFTEGRVVGAYETGAWAEARKWVRRNRPLAAAMAAVVLAVVVGGIGFALKADEATKAAELAREEAARADAKAEEAQANRTLAQRNEAEAQAQADDVLRLSALQDLEDLQTEAKEALWPAHPEQIGNLQAWVENAEALLSELPRHRAKREELRALALPQSEKERLRDRENHPDASRLAALSGELAARRRALLQRRDGEAAELPEVDWSAQPEGAMALNAQAWLLVRPDRTLFGQEGEGLLLARRALELARDDAAMRAEIGDTLAWALFALGRDDEAMDASAAALEAAPEESQGEYQGYLEELEACVRQASSEEGMRAATEEVGRLAGDLAELETRVAKRQDWRFPEEHAEARWWNAQLTKLIEGLEALLDAKSGLLSSEGVSAEFGWSVAGRLAFAQELKAGFSEGGTYAEAWSVALPGIREAYPGLGLQPLMGLLPIGPDPKSGLWEFAHLMTGVPAERGADGKLILTEQTGVVLVLLRGGRFWMGAQSSDPDGRGYDPQAKGNERPVHEVELSAFLLSKYEMTQGQWLRLTGRNPSFYQNGQSAQTLLHPVEEVSWLDCMKWLPRAGLRLPSEAQWEYGARGGTDTPWWTGAERESLQEQHAANLADQAAARADISSPDIEEWPDLDDGYSVHAPAGTYAANAFGLHEVAGNLWELCLDGYEERFYDRSPKLDPTSPWQGAAGRVARGGCFLFGAIFARSSDRNSFSPPFGGYFLGVRPARAIDP